MEQVKKMCYIVGRELGKGFSESIYQEGIAVLLRRAKIEYSKEMTMQVLFKGVYIGNVRADIVLPKEQIVIECKAIDGNLKTSHIPQIINYLEIMKLSKGVFVNFNQNCSKEMVEIITVNKNKSGVYEAEMPCGESVLLTNKGSLVKPETDN